MAAGGISGRTGQGNQLALFHLVADLDDQLGVVAVAGLYVISMADGHAHA